MGHLSIFHIDAKRILNTFQIRREKTHRQQDSLKTKLNLHSRVCNFILDLRMKWVLLPYSELYSEDKRPMGHIAHLRRQFKSINTYGCIITLIKRRK